jgi:hypothetical protein
MRSSRTSLSSVRLSPNSLGRFPPLQFSIDRISVTAPGEALDDRFDKSLFMDREEVE